MIWSEVIAISTIKKSQKKNKHFKWKTCWVMSITTTKLQILHIINEKHCFPSPLL